MKKILVVCIVVSFVLFDACNKDSARDHVTTPITAGAILKNYFVYKEFTPAVLIKISKDTGIYPVLYTDTHLPNLFLLKYPLNDDNVLTFGARKTTNFGSRFYNVSNFSEIEVSGSTNASLYSIPLQKGDSISNSLNWVSSLVLTTNDTALYQEPVFDAVINSYVNAPPYIKNLWTKKSYLATRIINSSDTTFGWIQLQANEDSATVTIFKYGQQW